MGARHVVVPPLIVGLFSRMGRPAHCCALASLGIAAGLPRNAPCRPARAVRACELCCRNRRPIFTASAEKRASAACARTSLVSVSTPQARWRRHKSAVPAAHGLVDGMRCPAEVVAPYTAHRQRLGRRFALTYAAIFAVRECPSARPRRGSPHRPPQSAVRCRPEGFPRRVDLLQVLRCGPLPFPRPLLRGTAPAASLSAISPNFLRRVRGAASRTRPAFSSIGTRSAAASSGCQGSRVCLALERYAISSGSGAGREITATRR